MPLWFAARGRVWGSRLFSCSMLVLAFTGVPPPSHSQSGPAYSKPYAKLDRSGVTYRGPAGANENELSDGVATIGMILPLSGPAQAEGKALLASAQIALEEEQVRGPLSDGRQLRLMARDESGPWGQASSEILQLVEQDHAVVVFTSANGNTAHQADQIANKVSFPILTLSSDPTTTQTNVPWLFRLGPSDTDQAHAFCRRIYEELRLRNVLLITQADHDGRIGGAEFEKSARELNAKSPQRLDMASSATNLEPLNATIHASNPEAVVLWTDSVLAGKLIPLIRTAAASTPVFLCQKAAQPPRADSNAGLLTIGPLANQPNRMSANFEQLYRQRTGQFPGLAAVETYEAVHMIGAGLRCVGASRVLLREYFATLRTPADGAQMISFDPAGNSTQKFGVVELAPTTAAASRP